MPTFTRWKIWLKMLFGKSDLHLEQPLGGFVSIHDISGYYNDLSKKVTFNKKTEKTIAYIPMFTNDYGKKVVFPIQIIQYALGCYELFLKTNNDLYIKKMIHCSDYVLNLINDDGSISCMYFVKGLNNPYSAMCQGECVSLLIRVFKETKEQKYLDGAKKVYSFLIDSNNVNAVIKSFNGLNNCLFEYPDKGIVLNGYIFALFGLFDMYLLTRGEIERLIFESSLKSLKNIMPLFVCDEWSYYDLDKHYASKFYHKLHINLLLALNLICENQFVDYVNIWGKGLKNKTLSIKMFWKKAMQKIKHQ